jgi:hypothetical protein
LHVREPSSVWPEFLWAVSDPIRKYGIKLKSSRIDTKFWDLTCLFCPS